MAVYKYTTANDNMAKIKYALKTCLFGEGLSILCDIEIVEKEYGMSTIIFKTKDENKEIDPMEWFVFGIMLGRDYMQPRKVVINPKITKLANEKAKEKN